VRLAYATHFELFLKKKFTAKRFGVDGGESYVVALQTLIDQVARVHGADAVHIGMAHRGRLNTLANVLRKPLQQIFCEFQVRT
jgi:2-oxoglutarate dehydrogenase E1 component